MDGKAAPTHPKSRNSSVEEGDSKEVAAQVFISSNPPPVVCRVCGHALSEAEAGSDVHVMCEEFYDLPMGAPF